METPMSWIASIAWNTEMAKICPTCNLEQPASTKRHSAWVPIAAAVGLSAAAFLVYRQIRRTRGPNLDVVIDHCARAASALERRLGDGLISIAS